MPVVTFSARELCRVIGRDVPVTTLAERLPHIGGEVSAVEGDKITFEWFPNRTDLLVLEGTGRAARAFLGVKTGLSTYSVAKPKTELKVDASVAAVRPFAALCIVRGVPFDADYLKTVIEAQEKLTHSPGRRRRKIAIGIHDAASISGPFVYTCVGAKDKPFIPLGSTTAQTPAEIVASHPKGKEFGHLLPKDKFPVFLDGKGAVLSMPPIINAQKTAVTAQTRDLILDVTGTDLPAVKQTIALLATAFAERGGSIEGVTIHDASGTWVAPDLKPSERVLHTDDIAALLGGTWSGEDAAICLTRMGHDAQAFDNKVHVKSPAWRFDLLHPVDLIEDVAIGKGFENIPIQLPMGASFGAELPTQRLEDRVRLLMIGHGWHEAKTLTLSDDRAQWTAWGEAVGIAVRVLNPALEEQALLRVKLAPSLLGVLAANRHRNLPQRLFEAGTVVHKMGNAWRNKAHVAGVELAGKTGFSDVKGLVLALIRDAGLDANLEPSNLSGLTKGRQGKIVYKGRDVGYFGELHPDTILAFGLGAPATVFEFDLSSFA